MIGILDNGYSEPVLFTHVGDNCTILRFCEILGPEGEDIVEALRELVPGGKDNVNLSDNGREILVEGNWTPELADAIEACLTDKAWEVTLLAAA